ncbi:MAG: ABC transporter permease [Alphaproteobacteria bacterium]
MALLLHIALTHLLSRKRQTLVSVFGVAMGVGFSIGIAAMMQGFQQDFVDRVINNTPNIIMKDEFRSPPKQAVEIAHADATIELLGQKPRDEVNGIRQAGQIIDVLSRRGDLVVAPVLQGQIFLRYGSKDVSANLIGIEPELERRVTNIEKDLVQGSLEQLRTAANGVIIGSGLAKKLGAQLNDTVTAVSPAGVILRVKIVGILRTGVVAIDETTGYALLKKVQVLQNRTNVVNQIRMKADDVSQARAIAADIEARFTYRTESWEETNEGVFGIFVIQNGVMYSTTGAILLVACFGIFNVISTVIFEKTRDIAILKSMGFHELDIRKIFLMEGMILGLIGGLAGWALGFGIIQVLASIRFDVGGIVTAQGFILNRSFTNYWIAGALAFTAATLAAYIPAKRAARVNPVQIIRGAS